MLKLAYGVLLAFCGTILVHIAIIFLIPLLSEQKIIAHLQTLSLARDPVVFSGNEISTDPSNTSPNGIGLLGLDPFFRYRVCFYDLADGTFLLASTGDVPFFSAALMSENGDVLFSITDRQTINRKLNVEVRASAEQQRLSQFTTNDSDSAVPVYVPVSKGYAIVRAFVPDGSWDTIVDGFLSNIVCLSGTEAG